MADLMTDSFRRAKIIQLNHLEPQARIQFPCVLVNRLYVRHAWCGCILFKEKPAMEQSLVNFCCSGRSANFLSYATSFLVHRHKSKKQGWQ